MRIYWQLREAVEKYGIEKSEMLDDLCKLMHELTAERAALANGRDGDRFHLIIEDGDVANYDCPHFFTVRLDSELLQKQFHGFLRYPIRKCMIPMGEQMPTSLLGREAALRWTGTKCILDAKDDNRNNHIPTVRIV